MTFPLRLVRPSRLPGAVLVTAMLCASAAGAQGAGVPGQYRAVTSALDGAVRMMAQDPSRSLLEIDRARENFDQLATNFRGPLVAGVRSSLQNARIAVGRSPADLEAQTAQVRGVLRKLLHDRALGGVSRGDQNAVVEIGVLADDFGLTGATRAAVVDAARAGDADRTQRLLERTAAAKVQASLQAANGAATAAAYVAVAGASGWFTIVQDSPRVGRLSVQRFVDALTALTQNDMAAFRSQLALLQTDAQAFRDAAAQAASAAPSQPAAKAAPVEVKAAAAPAATAAPSGVPSRPQPAVQPAAVNGSLADVYVPLGRAMSAATRGDVPAAQLEVGSAASELDQLPADVRSQPSVQALRAALAGTSAAIAVRPADVQALMLQVAVTEDAVAGRTARMTDTLSVGAASAFGGPVRAAVFVLLALLTAWPLYLLNLAFGGRNPYWRAISASVVLLMLPLVLEGIASLSVLVAQFTGATALAVAASGSVLQTPFGQVLWAVLSVFGITLMAWGFRGICVQFGLLGRRTAGAEATSVQQPAVDWDDEP